MFDLNNVKTPCYIVDEAELMRNLEILRNTAKISGCKILLAQKAFSMYSVYPLISRYLDGTAASGLFEAKLGREHFGKEVHVFSPAYTEDEMDSLVKIADNIVFNSFRQWDKYKYKVKSCGRNISCGIRVNPEYSEIDTEIYDPCAPNSRLGVTADQFDESKLGGIDGLHFHTLCEQDSDTLKRTLTYFEKSFGKYLYNMKWVNFGGGHHITRKDYDITTLVECISYISKKYDVQVYLEPGEAVALNAGYLAAQVLDVGVNGMNYAILDTSAACHMPDVLEMPYRPFIMGSGMPGEKKHTYRFGGPTCLAGDIIGDYSFDSPLKEGDRLVFCDMAIYSMVKNNTFNGMPLPSIYLNTADGELRLIKSFGYEDFKSRL
ncbi:carboxynorspermidine decarboxylase [Hominimerdicola sp. 21CYCFAH17_S]